MSNKKSYPEDVFVEKNKVNFNVLFSKMISGWYWFVISMVICLVISYAYLRYTPQTYNTSAKILITSDKAANAEQDALAKALGGQFGTANNVQGEAEILKTRHLMEKVIVDLKSYITYYHKGQVRSVDLYKDTPVKITLLQSPDSISPTDLEVTLQGNVAEVKSGVFTKKVNLNELFAIPGLGKVQLEKGPGYNVPGSTYVIKVSSVQQVVSNFLSKLRISIPIKDVNILTLDFTSQVPKSAEDILNKLITSYVSGNILDKNTIADSTISFIEDRLRFVGQELGRIEGDVQTFKQKNKVTDIAAQSGQLITSTSEYMDQLAKAETQISVLNSVEKHVLDARTNKSIVPSGALLEDPGFASLVERYNVAVLEKEKAGLRQTEDNPYMQNLNAQIGSARSDMLSSLRSLRSALVISRDKVKSRTNIIAGQVKDVPAVERTYLDLARQQQIKQDLYVFLMTKREETAISKTSNISNCKIIEPPVSSGPVSPVRTNVLGYGFILGLFIPFSIFFAFDRLNTKINTKEEVKNLTQISIIGEIGKSLDISDAIVTNHGSRTAISEQFRALRTNLAFFLKEGQKTIMLTSSMSGEGKSFLSINLAAILALSGKKVIVLEMDLRKPTLSHKLKVTNDIGFTNYIISQSLTLHDIIKPSGVNDKLQIITSGNMPPNPSEIILSDRTDLLIKDLYEIYDYIIIDAPPVGLVTDAQLLSKYADLTLYVVRQGFTFKDQLSIVQELHSGKKIKNMAILLNDVKNYGGYGYGYGYGVELEEKGFIAKLFRSKS